MLVPSEHILRLVLSQLQVFFFQVLHALLRVVELVPGGRHGLVLRSLGFQRLPTSLLRSKVHALPAGPGRGTALELRLGILGLCPGSGVAASSSGTTAEG